MSEVYDNMCVRSSFNYSFGIFFSFPDDNNLVELVSAQAAHQAVGQPSSSGDDPTGTSGTTYINASYIQVGSLYFVPPGS